MNHNPKDLSQSAHEATEAGAQAAHNLVSRAANKADEVVNATQRATADTEKTVRDGLNTLREAVPATLSRAATQAEELARTGIDKARSAGNQVAARAHDLNDSTMSYVREEPTKALLMAMAAGAAVTLLISWATSNRSSNRY